MIFTKADEAGYSHTHTYTGWYSARKGAEGRAGESKMGMMRGRGRERR